MTEWGVFTCWNKRVGNFYLVTLVIFEVLVLFGLCNSCKNNQL